MLNKYVIWLKNIKICFICFWEPSKQGDQAWMGGREKIGEAKLHRAFAKRRLSKGTLCLCQAKALNPRPWDRGQCRGGKERKTRGHQTMSPRCVRSDQ